MAESADRGCIENYEEEDEEEEEHAEAGVGAAKTSTTAGITNAPLALVAYFVMYSMPPISWKRRAAAAAAAAASAASASTATAASASQRSGE